MTSRLIEQKAKWSTDLGLDANPAALHGAPVSFTASVASMLPGQTQVLSTSGLANGYRTPYVIDEIRMQAYNTEPQAFGTQLQTSYAMQFQFRTGAYAFSMSPVPLMLHAPFYAITRPDGFSSGGSLRSVFTAAATRLGDEARWLLAKPLWMAPGDQIQCSVFRAAVGANAGNQPFNADVTYVGRSLPPGTRGPRVRYVPWIANYVHDLANTYSETTTEFRNPFTMPLHIQRLIGKPMSKATSGVFFTNEQYMSPVVSGTPQYVTSYIEDSLGYKITRDYTAVANIFDSTRCSWTFQRPIGPREQLNMKFRTVRGQANSALFGVAMQGYREER